MTANEIFGALIEADKTLDLKKVSQLNILDSFLKGELKMQNAEITSDESKSTVSGDLKLFGSTSPVKATISLPSKNENSWYLAFSIGKGIISLADGISGLKKISNLSITSALPAQMELKQVSLTDFSLGFNVKNQTIDYVAFTVSVGNKWKFIPKICEVQDIKLHLDITDPLVPERIAGIGIQGSLAWGKSPFTYVDIEAGNFSGYSIRGKLREGSVVKVDKLVNSLFSVDLLPKLDITSLSFQAQSRDQYQLHCGVTENWIIDLFGATTLELRNTQFDFLFSKTNSTYRLGAKLLLAGVDISLSAEYQKSGNKSGWAFMGYGAEEKSIPIGHLLNDITSRFGSFHLPEILKGLTISNLMVSFNTVTKQFLFGFKSEIVIGDSPFVASISINTTPEGAGGYKKEIQAFIDFKGLVLEMDLSSGSPATSIKLTSVSGEIKLDECVKELLTVVGVSINTPLPPLDVYNIVTSFNTSTKDFSFSADTSTQIEIPFLTGKDAKIHAKVNLQSAIDAATGNRQLSGFMEGDFTIGTSKFTLQYAVGKDSHVFEASWESTSDQDLLGIDTFLQKMGVSHDVSISPKLDLNLKKVYLQYQAERETLMLVADSASYGEVFLIVSKLPIGQPHPDESVPDPGTSDWQFVFGWNYEDISKLSAVPGIGSQFKPADILHFESLSIIISSADIKQFEIPDMPAMKMLTSGADASTQNAAQIGTSSTPRKPVAQGSTIPLGKGLAFVAVLDMAKSDQSGNMPSLRTIVPDPTLTVVTAIDLKKKAFTIMALLDGSVTIPTGGKSDLKIGNAALSFIFNDGPAFQISGELAMHFDHETINVDPKLTVMVEGIEFQVNVVFKNGWKKAMGIPGLTLDVVGFELGVDFIPPGVNIGLKGQSHIGKQPKSSDNFAFVLEVIEEIPDPLLLSFYLKEIDIPTAMQVFVPEQKLPSLPTFVKQIKMTEVSFYWAQEPVPLPDGTIAQPGLRFGGNLQILSFQAHAALAIDQTSGIAGEFEMSPVHFHNILSISGKGQGVYLNKKNGKVLPVKVKPDKDQTGVEKVEIVAPGGPVFAFRTTQSPYLQVSIEVSFLDMLHEEIEALVQSDGIYFKLEYEIGSLARAEIDFTLTKAGFTAHSYFGLHLKADIGPIKILGIDFGTIHLDTGFDIELFVTASPEKFEFSVNGEFDFEGARLHFPELKLEFAPKSLEELPKLIIEHIIENADEIFKDLFDAAGKLIKEGVKELEHLGEEAGEEIAKIATEAEQEAEKIVGEAARAVEHTVEEAAAEVEKIKQEAAQVLTDAKNEVVKIGEAAEEEVEKIGTEIVHVAEEAEKEVEEIGKEIAEEADVVAKAVAKLASEAAEEVKAIAKAVADEVAKVLDEARKVADAVIDAAKKVVSALEDEAKALWNEAKKLAEAIEEAAKKVAHAVEHTAKKVWHAISKY